MIILIILAILYFKDAGDRLGRRFGGNWFNKQMFPIRVIFYTSATKLFSQGQLPFNYRDKSCNVQQNGIARFKTR